MYIHNLYFLVSIFVADLFKTKSFISSSIIPGSFIEQNIDNICFIIGKGRTFFKEIVSYVFGIMPFFQLPFLLKYYGILYTLHHTMFRYRYCTFYTVNIYPRHADFAYNVTQIYPTVTHPCPSFVPLCTSLLLAY